MRPEYATVQDFQYWEARSKTLTSAELMYVIRDCQQAEKAMRGHNPVKEGFYSDQATTYGMEFTRREKLARI